ncbi:MAG: hypothetical protein R6U22_05410 [Desulfohalobiaceae bacterium]
MSISIQLHQQSIGVIRVYTFQSWVFTLEDINFVQAIAQIIGLSVEMSRMYKAHKDAIFVLKGFNEVAKRPQTRRTPYEWVPVSVSKEKVEPKTS